MSQTPDAWSADPWTAPPPNSSTLSATSTPFSPSSTHSTHSQPSPQPTKKQSKFLKRQQQAEFNRQVWADAETPQNETNYFLSTRNVVPLKQEFKQPTTVLRRGGMPVVQRRVKKEEAAEGIVDGVGRMGLNGSGNGRQEESSEDEDDVKEQQRLEVERKERSKVEREEKQKKYEERRHELFGTTKKGGGTVADGSAGSSPGVTPPGSRSATPNRGRGGRGRGSRGGGGMLHGQKNGLPMAKERGQDLFDPMSVSKTQGERRSPRRDESVVQPARMPRGPDGSGRGGFGFGARGGGQAIESTI